MDRSIVDRIVDQNLGVYRAAASRLQEDVSQEAQVANDYRGRLVYELLQNSDDAMEGQPTDSDRVTFRVTDNALWVANSGRALTDADIQGLCGLGASSKVDSEGTRRASIGHKGLGFKSVLEITDSPAVFSLNHSFRLGTDQARPHVDGLFSELKLDPPRAVPVMRFPSAIDEPERESEWVTLRDSGMNTAFKFPFRADLDSERRTALAERLLALPLTTVLFLKHLESVVVEVDQSGLTASREWRIDRQIRRDDVWVTVPGFGGSGIYEVTVSSSDSEQSAFYVAHDNDVEIGHNRVGISGPAWDGVDVTEVSVAALSDGTTDEMPEDWKHFHVFLPTEEPCPYPMLVNGAFSTDLSRQRIRVNAETGHYNSHIIRQAAHLFVSELVPLLREGGTERVLEVLDRGLEPDGGETAALLHLSLMESLSSEPLLPTEMGEVLPLSGCVLPSSLVEAEGELFRDVLAADATWNGAEFPTSTFCRGRWARVAADHGAHQLAATDCVTALGQAIDPERSGSRDHESSGYEVDPILELCALLWERADATERAELEERARQEPVFPIHRNDDGTVVRVALQDDTAFYPPQSARKDFPLRGLRFMCHSMCWGALNKNERNSMLGDELKTWSALFDIKEFRFQEVMQASVLPALGLFPSTEERQWRSDLHELEALAAICQLAGSFTKPDRPLRYQRLQSDRAIFNLSRLPVLCINDEGVEEWIPAYRVYFGSEWTGGHSFEHVVEGVREVETDGEPLGIHFLAPPDRFLGLLETLEEADAAGTLVDDEVDLDEDVDRSLETSELERWLNFFSWVGVNRCLRLVHFHDVEDRDTGWLTTKELEQPQGWAFTELGDTWVSFREQITSSIARRADRDEVVPYLYDAHDLDHALPLVSAVEKDASNTVAFRLFEHIVLNWDSYASMTDVHVALVDKGKWPSARSKPQRALPEEVLSIGDNLWLHRLRRSGICPTTRGPRSPSVTWRRTPELERRFSSKRGRRDAGDLVPVLDHSAGLPMNSLRAFCDRMGVGAEPSPSTFTVEDADHLCRQLAYLYGENADDSSALRHVIRPAYRSLFELLSGQARSVGSAVLQKTPLLAETTDGFRFLPAEDVLFASTPGIKERSGLAGRVPIFVLEAEPAAEAPLTTIFGCRVLEKVLDWHPDPGESALNGPELSEFREGMEALVAPLLARIRAERSLARDRSDLVEFMRKIEPVSDLNLACRLDGEPLERLSGRSYFVRRRSGPTTFQGFVVWHGVSWPPSPEPAQSLAMALADTLGVNLVETFLAFITSSDAQRGQLLDIAGASGHLLDVMEELAEGPTEDLDDVIVGEALSTAAPRTDGLHDERAAVAPVDQPAPAAPRVPLHSFSSLWLDGEALVISGEGSPEHETVPMRDGGKPRVGGGSSGRAAAGTDLSALDFLGMQITLAYEVRRLRLLVDSVAVIAGQELHGVGDSLVVEVHTPAAILRAENLSPVVKSIMAELEASGASRNYPGFDILTIRDGQIDRLIELKSSGVDARVQAMSWNEWKSAANSDLRERYWLYLCGNLRADLEHAVPYVRAIKDPFGALSGDTVEDRQLRRSVQLRVREFDTAEHLDLSVMPQQGKTLEQ